MSRLYGQSGSNPGILHFLVFVWVLAVVGVHLVPYRCRSVGSRRNEVLCREILKFLFVLLLLVVLVLLVLLQLLLLEVHHCFVFLVVGLVLVLLVRFVFVAFRVGP